MNRLDPARAVACATLLLFTHTVTAQVYKTVDAEGRVIYTDRPSPGAEQVPLGQVNSMPKAEPTAPPARAKPTAGGPPYTSIAILEPADGATVTNPGGNFSVQFALEPALRDGDTLQLLVDGQSAGTISGSNVQLEGVLRGEHTLELIVIDSSGGVAARASPVRITLIRPPAGRRVIN
jgi:hypothetical protein